MNKYSVNEPVIKDLMAKTAPEEEPAFLAAYASVVNLLEAAWIAGKQKISLEKALPIVRRKRPGER